MYNGILRNRLVLCRWFLVSSTLAHNDLEPPCKPFGGVLQNSASERIGRAVCSELATLLLLILSPLMIPGQSTTASLTGRISDSHRAVISAATVQVINTSTGIHYHGLTNEAGIYYVSDLPPGAYRIEVEKLGFIAVIESGIILHVQDALEVN
jgi:hypothetical protein